MKFPIKLALAAGLVVSPIFGFIALFSQESLWIGLVICLSSILILGALGYLVGVVLSSSHKKSKTLLSLVVLSFPLAGLVWGSYSYAAAERLPSGWWSSMGIPPERPLRFYGYSDQGSYGILVLVETESGKLYAGSYQIWKEAKPPKTAVSGKTAFVGCISRDAPSPLPGPLPHPGAVSYFTVIQCGNFAHLQKNYALLDSGEVLWWSRAITTAETVEIFSLGICGFFTGLIPCAIAVLLYKRQLRKSRKTTSQLTQETPHP